MSVISGARLRAARMLPGGFSEATAETVRRTLESSWHGAPHAAMEQIVRHATTAVPFYQRLRGRTSTSASPTLDRLPVVDKSMMVAAPEDFLDASSRPGELHQRMSSGSSGIPFPSYSDGPRLSRHRAALVGGYRYLGADPFGAFVHCRPWFQASRRERLSYALRGQYLYSGEQDEDSLRAVARWITRRRPTTIIGLCTFIETLFRGLEERGISVPPGAVSTVLGVGEPASRYLSDATPRLTGIPLSRRYSSTELGIIGFARAGSEQYQLDTSTYHVEILKLEEDAPSSDGETGRIVITDLHNRAMPFLRYDTGDLGCLAMSAQGTPVPNLLVELSGRRSDALVTGTESAPRRGSFYQLFMRVDSNPEIRQFQLRQKAVGRFTWVLRAEPSRTLEARILRLMDEEVGDVVECTFEYVSGVPLAQSGKSRFFVSEIADPEELLSPSTR